MQKILLFWCLLLGFISVNAQNRQLPDIYGNSTDADELCKNNSFDTNDDMQSVMDTIRRRLRIKATVRMMECSAVSNCKAQFYRNKPFVLYNSNYVNQLRGLQFTTARLPKIDWRMVGVLTHELAHITLLHQTRLDQDDLELKDLEVEADSLGGYYSQQLGATLQQAQSCLYHDQVSEKGGRDHPSRSIRLAAVARGYNQAKEQNKVQIQIQERVVEKPVTLDDRDGDGLANNIDDCPDEAGKVKCAGCPCLDDKPKPPTPRKDLPQLPEVVLVKGGTFTMGDVMGDKEETDETTHEVTVSDFYIGKYEVTFEEYDLFCDATGKEKPSDSGWGRGKRPVINVSWDDAVAYCAWASQISGRTYRLPTEAEWEYAARGGGKKVRFGNGKNTLDPSEANFDGRADYKKEYSVVGDYRGKTMPVGSFADNSLDLYDMSGNVREWCSDWYGSYPTGSVSNPTGSTTGTYRVLRGGSWSFIPQDCRVAARIINSPTYRLISIGFRLAVR